MTASTFRVSTPRDLLSVVPFQLGFQPSDSLVLVSLRGPRHRVGLVLRVDLPAPEHADAVADQVTDHLRRDGAESTLAVLYSGHEDPLGPSGDVLTDLVARVADALDDRGIGLVDVWHIGPSRYRSLACRRSCCPPDGFPTEELLATVLSAEMLFRGCVVAPDRQSLLGDLNPMGTERLAAVERAASRLGRDRRRWARAQLGRWREEVARAGEAMAAEDAGQGTGEAADVAPGTAGRLLAALGDPHFRDAVMLACVPGSGLEPEAFVAADGTTPGADRLFGAVFGATSPLRPDVELLDAASRVLRSLVRQASGARGAPPLALLGWLSWWSGDGAAANDFTDRALAVDPGHRLGLLLAESLERGVAPGWARSDRSKDVLGEVRT
jgi:Domain of unknown function (DUF4192)